MSIWDASSVSGGATTLLYPAIEKSLPMHGWMDMAEQGTGRSSLGGLLHASIYLQHRPGVFESFAFSANRNGGL